MAYQFDPAIIARLLQGVGTAATAYGSGSPQWGMAGAQAIGDAQAQQRQQQQDALRDGLLRQQMQQQQQALDDAAAQRAGAQKAFGSLLPGQSPAGVRNQSTGAFDTTPTGTSPLDKLPPEVAAYIKTRGSYDPAGALDLYGQYATKTPDIPTLQEFDNPDGTAYKGYLKADGSVAKVGDSYPRWQPPQPKGPSEMKQRALDAGLKVGTPEYRNFMLTGGVTPKAKGITTFYGPDGTPKSLYDDDASIPGLMQSGWTTAKPEKAGVTYQTLSGDDLAKINPNLDKTKTWKVGSDGSATVVDKPEAAATSYKTVTGADASVLNLDPAKTWSVGSDGSAKIVDKPAAAAGAIITGDDAKKLNLDPTGTYQQRPDGAYAVLVKPRAEGTFGGNALDAQDSNIILKGQADDNYRSTPEYAMAWARQYQTPHYQMVQDQNDPAKTTLVAIPPTVPQGMKPPTNPMPVPQPGGPSQQPASQSSAAAPQPSTPAAVPVPGTGGQKQLNGEQALSKGFSERMSASNAILLDPKVAATGTNVVQGLASGTPIIGNYLTSDDRQKLEQAERDFINAQLRRESGAAISSGEFDNARQQYFPQPGDSAAVLEQKAANRALVIKGMQQSASPYPLPDAKSAADLKKKYGLQ